RLIVERAWHPALEVLCALVDRLRPLLLDLGTANGMLSDDRRASINVVVGTWIEAPTPDKRLLGNTSCPPSQLVAREPNHPNLPDESRALQSTLSGSHGAETGDSRWIALPHQRWNPLDLPALFYGPLRLGLEFLFTGPGPFRQRTHASYRHATGV